MSCLGVVHCLEQSVCMSTHHILVVAAETQSKVFFWNRTQNSWGRQSNDSKTATTKSKTYQYGSPLSHVHHIINFLDIRI